MSPSGREAILATLRPGDSFDEMAVLGTYESRASAEAISDCIILFLRLPIGQPASIARTEILSCVLEALSDHADRIATQVEILKVQTGPNV